VYTTWEGTFTEQINDFVRKMTDFQAVYQRYEAQIRYKVIHDERTKEWILNVAMKCQWMES